MSVTAGRRPAVTPLLRLPWGSVARLGSALAVVVLALCPSALGAAPAVQARAYIVQSSVDGHTLAARGADDPRAMASITKLMTVLVALERLPLDDVVTVPRAAAGVGESSLRLRAGRAHDRARPAIGALVPSANDAADGARRRTGGSLPRFVALMNAKARELGLTRTHFENPHGLDQPGTSRPHATPPCSCGRPCASRSIRRYAGMRRARCPTAASSSRPTTCSAGSAVRRGQDGPHDACRLVAGRVRAGSAGSRSRRRCSARRPRRSAIRDLAALLRFGLASYRSARVVDAARTYAPCPSAGASRRSGSSRRGRSSARRRSARPLVERVVVAAGRGAARRRRPAARDGRRARRVSAWSRARRSSPPVLAAEPGPAGKASLGRPPHGPPSRRARLVRVGGRRDRHRHPQRRARPVAHRPDAAARPAPPGERRAHARRRQGDQRRPRAQAARRPRRRDRPRGRAHRHADRRGADRGGDPQRLRPHPRRVAHVDRSSSTRPRGRRPRSTSGARR